MWEGSAGLVGEDIGEPLKTKLDILGSIFVLGEVGTFSPYLLMGKYQWVIGSVENEAGYVAYK